MTPSPQPAPAPPGDDAPSGDRFARGWEFLRRIDPHAGEHLMATLGDVAPDFARLIIEFQFGDIFSRPGLSLAQRELAVLAGLTCLGHAVPQIKVHAGVALHAGCTRQEIVEVVMQMALFAGFPAAINALRAVREAFEEDSARSAGAP